MSWRRIVIAALLGALMLSAACFIVAASLRRFAFSPWVLLALAAVSAVYLLLARQYWFRIPVLGTAVATACLAGAWLLYLL